MINDYWVGPVFCRNIRPTNCQPRGGCAVIAGLVLVGPAPIVIALIPTLVNEAAGQTSNCGRHHNYNETFYPIIQFLRTSTFNTLKS